MINLSIKDYCHGCPHFKADVHKIEKGASKATTTYILCEHAARCNEIAKHIEDKIKQRSGEN